MSIVYLPFEGQLVILVSRRSANKAYDALIARLRRPRINWITIDDPKVLIDRGPKAVISVSFDSRMRKNKKGGEYSSMFHKVLSTVDEALDDIAHTIVDPWLNPLY